MTNNVQLDGQLSKMINEFNKQRESGLICDTECQNQQNIRNWQHTVTQKQNILSTAPQELLNAQRELASYDSSYRTTFASNVKKLANTQIDKLQNEFDQARQSILQDLDFYDTQMAFKNSMQDISNYQKNKLYDGSQNVAKNTGDNAVNHRLATFYSKQTNLVSRTISYLRIIYWILFAIQITATIINFRKIKNKFYIILGIVILALFPLYNTLYPIFEKIFHILKLFPSP